MEILLALLVLGAVLLFGALITVGNERQRRAIDALRQQAELWAVGDLKLKREGLAYQARVDDPLGWLNRLASEAAGSQLHLQRGEAFADPPALMCKVQDRDEQFVFSSLSPVEVRRLRQDRRDRLFQYTQGNPLMALPRRATVYKFSLLNGGILFDLELPLAWRALTGQQIGEMDKLWMYVLK
jgi:hypothetical protein